MLSPYIEDIVRVKRNSKNLLCKIIHVNTHFHSKISFSQPNNDLQHSNLVNMATINSLQQIIHLFFCFFLATNDLKK